ncbi:unnamed protein product [Auanema sp. JU1783]|nr:unnamed protein product [Auanema sp. JU1783]
MRSVFGVLVLIVAAAATTDCNTSQLATIKKCYQTYLAAFNTTFDQDLPEYWVYLHDPRMNWLLKDGVNIAQPAVCQLGNNLVQCVAGTRPCMTSHTYTQLGAYNGTEANDYQIDLAVTQYQCGAGYNILMQNFYCLESCRSSHQNLLDKCDASMKTNVILHGLCKAAQINADCQANVFSNCCGHNAGVFMCNNVVQGVNALYPECVADGKLKCQQPMLALIQDMKAKMAMSKVL